jgi:tetratricopeptide (TPR) repeat protein
MYVHAKPAVKTTGALMLVPEIPQKSISGQMALSVSAGLLRFLFLQLLLLLFCNQAVALNPQRADSADELLRRGDYAAALEILQQTFASNPYNATIRNNLAVAHAYVGKQYLDGKRFDEAAEQFDKARTLDAETTDYVVLRGIALYLGKHYDEATITLEQARLVRNEDGRLLYYLGLAYYDTGKLSAAREVWESALVLDADNKAIRELVARAGREEIIESRMGKGYSSMFSISYDEGTTSNLATAVLETLEAAYNQVGSDLSYYPVTHVPVILYTRKDYRSVTAGPEWSGGLYDGKVRLPIGGVSELTPQLRGLLFHEYSHVVVGELTKGNCPVWLNEGLAEIAGRREYDSPLSELAGAVKSTRLLSVSELEKSFASLNTKDVALAYQQSYSLVRFMIASYGLYKVRDLLDNLGRGLKIGAAVAATFADFGLNYQGIIQEWQASIMKEYGR